MLCLAALCVIAIIWIAPSVLASIKKKAFKTALSESREMYKRLNDLCENTIFSPEARATALLELSRADEQLKLIDELGARATNYELDIANASLIRASQALSAVTDSTSTTGAVDTDLPTWVAPYPDNNVISDWVSPLEDPGNNWSSPPADTGVNWTSPPDPPSSTSTDW